MKYLVLLLVLLSGCANEVAPEVFERPFMPSPHPDTFFTSNSTADISFYSLMWTRDVNTSDWQQVDFKDVSFLLPSDFTPLLIRKLPSHLHTDGFASEDITVFVTYGNHTLEEMEPAFVNIADERNIHGKNATIHYVLKRLDPKGFKFFITAYFPATSEHEAFTLAATFSQPYTSSKIASKIIQSVKF